MTFQWLYFMRVCTWKSYQRDELDNSTFKKSHAHITTLYVTYMSNVYVYHFIKIWRKNAVKATCFIYVFLPGLENTTPICKQNSTKISVLLLWNIKSLAKLRDIVRNICRKPMQLTMCWSHSSSLTQAFCNFAEYTERHTESESFDNWPCFHHDRYPWHGYKSSCISIYHLINVAPSSDFVSLDLIQNTFITINE